MCLKNTSRMVVTELYALTHEEYDGVWSKFYEEFNFKPSIKEFPSYTPPSPFVTYDVSTCYGNDEPMGTNHYRIRRKATERFVEVPATHASRREEGFLR